LLGRTVRCWIRRAAHALLVGTGLVAPACGPQITRAAAQGGARAEERPLAGVRTFTCCYRSDLTPAELDGFDLAIVDADVTAEPEALRGERDGAQRVVLGYISIGEASTARADWARCAGKPFLVERNPDWDGAWRVDPRSTEWRDLVLARAAWLAQRGFDGFFLDTADVAEYLEQKDTKYAGAVRGMADLVLALRERFPRAPIVLNQGLALYPAVKPAVSGALAEGLFSRWDFAAKAYGPPPADEWHRNRLDRFEDLARSGLPVFSIEYAAPGDRAAARKAVEACRAHGFVAYIAELDLAKVRRDVLEVASR
jgi:uncharacterized protein (TIGR01370 family)